MKRQNANEVGAVGARYALNPNQQDAEFLLAQYKGTLQLFATLLYSGFLPKPQSSFVARFLILFGKDYAKTSNHLPVSFKGESKEDIEMFLICLFLETASNYTPGPDGTGNWVSYITRWFPYKLRDEIRKRNNELSSYYVLFGGSSELEMLEEMNLNTSKRKEPQE
jgi:hypothetical protein